MYRISAWIFFILIVPLDPARAGQPGDDNKLDKQATDILKQASDVLKNAKTLHVDTKLIFTMEDGQGKRTTNSEGSVDVEQPNRFAMRVRRVGEEGGISCVCDGKSLFNSAILLKQYTQSPAPDDLFKMGRTLLMTFDIRGAGALFLDALAEDPYESFMNGVNACTYAGKEKLGDTPVHHLKFAQDGLNWEIWVAAEGKPLVLKNHSAGDGGNGVKFDMVESFHSWKVDENLAKDAFAFTPAKDAQRVQNLPGGEKK